MGRAGCTPGSLSEPRPGELSGVGELTLGYVPQVWLGVAQSPQGQLQLVSQRLQCRDLQTGLCRPLGFSREASGWLGGQGTSGKGLIH